MKGGVSMAIYYMHVSRISRGKGKSAVAAAAYRSGEKIRNEYDNHTHDFSDREDVAYSNIYVPVESPEWARERSLLWNEVERSEKRVDANTARQIEVALPRELNREQQVELINDYADYFVKQHKMCVDVSLHDKNDGNPHVHLLMTTREINRDGFSDKKIKDLDKKDRVFEWRKEWEVCTNKALERANLDIRIDCRSYKARGLGIRPMIHLGPAVTAMERRGIKTDLGNINRVIKKYNEVMNEWRETLRELFKKIRRDNLERYAADRQRVDKNKQMVKDLLDKASKNISIIEEEKKLKVAEKIVVVENDRLQLINMEIKQVLRQKREAEKLLKTDEDIEKEIKKVLTTPEIRKSVAEFTFLDKKYKEELKEFEIQPKPGLLNFKAKKAWENRKHELEKMKTELDARGTIVKNLIAKSKADNAKKIESMRKELKVASLASERKILNFEKKYMQLVKERKSLQDKERNKDRKVKAKERDGWER